MKAKEMYIQATGDKEPDNQIFYNEWLIRYMRWLEGQVEYFVNLINRITIIKRIKI